jgi:type II secretory pathway pseudopilin PulG
MSFLEVVLALAILSMIAATTLSAISSITGQARASRQRLAAMELANRLVLQYMDDPTRMPRAELPLEYAQERYRWSFREGSVSMLPVIAPEERTTLGPRRLDRFKTITVTVWLGEESGGRAVPDEGTPGAVLTRLMDPYALRNPDAIERLLADPQRRQWFLEAFTGAAPSAPPPGSPSGGGGRNSGAGARPASGASGGNK